MQKFQCLAVHLLPKAKRFGNLSIFSEEGFEHVQQLSRRLRDGHTGNRPRGLQIMDDIVRINLQPSSTVRRVVGT